MAKVHEVDKLSASCNERPQLTVRSNGQIVQKLSHHLSFGRRLFGIHSGKRLCDTVTPAIADRSEGFHHRAAAPQRRKKCRLSLCIFFFFDIFSFSIFFTFHFSIFSFLFFFFFKKKISHRGNLVQDMYTRLLSANLDFDSELQHVFCWEPDECRDSRVFHVDRVFLRLC